MTEQEQAELEKVVQTSLAKTRGKLTNDDRILKAGKKGLAWCDERGLIGIQVDLYDPKDGHVTKELKGRAAMAYLLAGMASEIVKNEK